MKVTDGNATDFDVIADDLRNFCKQFDVQEIPYDPAMSRYFATKLAEEGLPLVEIRRAPMFFTQPLIQVENTVLEPASSSTTPTRDDLDDEQRRRARLEDHGPQAPDQGREENKIDGPVASLLALGRSMVNATTATPQIYDAMTAAAKLDQHAPPVARAHGLVASVRSRGTAPRRSCAGQRARALKWGRHRWDDWVRGNVGSTVKRQRTVCASRLRGLGLRQPDRRVDREHAVAHLPPRQDGDREAYKGFTVVAAERRPQAWLVSHNRGSTLSARAVPRRCLRAHSSRISHQPCGGRIRADPPDRIEVRKVDGRLHYVIAPDPQGDGYDTATRTEVVDQDDMLHVAGPGFNGRRSLSQLPVRAAQPRWHRGRGGQPVGAVHGRRRAPRLRAFEVPGDMKEDQREVLRQSWISRHTGQGAKKAPWCWPAA